MEIKKLQVTFTGIRKGVKYGFAKLPTGDDVYIGPNIFAQYNDIHVGNVINGQVGPNDPRFTKNGCMLRMVGIFEGELFKELVAKHDAATAQGQMFKEPAAQKPISKSKLTYDHIVSWLNSTEDFYTSAEIADYLVTVCKIDIDSSKVGSMMDNLHKRGDVAKLMLHQCFGQKGASKLAWCSNKHWREAWKNMLAPAE